MAKARLLALYRRDVQQSSFCTEFTRLDEKSLGKSSIWNIAHFSAISVKRSTTINQILYSKWHINCLYWTTAVLEALKEKGTWSDQKKPDMIEWKRVKYNALMYLKYIFMSSVYAASLQN